jgi:peptidoglycan/xylan/chitin deacetylase (PgdA/CDA1 family)
MIRMRKNTEHRSNRRTNIRKYIERCRYFVSLAVLIVAPVLFFAAAGVVANTKGKSAEGISATVLVYHRFGPVVADAMTVRTSVFASQLRFLHDNGYTVVPLREIVNFLTGHGELPHRAVAITADDGHRSVFTDMKPLIEKYNIPVTLFIYPSAISNASYAMTWEQLEELKATGLFEIESHTYWHPNFRVEKPRLSATEYRKFVELQMDKSRDVLERRFDTKVDMLAWPFGIFDDELIAAAQKAGYVAAFTIERRKVSKEDNIMAIPRFIVSDSDVGKAFERLLTQDPGVSPGRGMNRIDTGASKAR